MEQEGMETVTEATLEGMTHEDLLEYAIGLLEEKCELESENAGLKSEIAFERSRSEKPSLEEPLTNTTRQIHGHEEFFALRTVELRIDTNPSPSGEQRYNPTSPPFPPLSRDGNSPYSDGKTWKSITSTVPDVDVKIMKVTNAIDGTVCAVKEIKICANTADDLAKKIECFRTEIQLQAMLRHKNIVNFRSASYVGPGDLHDDDVSSSRNKNSPATRATTPHLAAQQNDEDSGGDSPTFSHASHRAVLYIFMDLCNAGTVRDYCGLDQKKELSLAERLHLFHGAADGLAHAHEENVIHRDIKPENLFVHKANDGTPTVQIGDFGLSCLAVEENGNHVAPDMVYGTPVYASPEQLKQATHGTSTDIYGLGVSMLELFAQIPHGDFVREWITPLSKGETPAGLVSTFEAFPDGDELQDLLQRMIDRDESKRPSAAEVKAKVAEWLPM